MGDSIDALMAPMSPSPQMQQMPQMPHQEGPPQTMPPPPPPAPMAAPPKPMSLPMNLAPFKEAFLIFVLVVLLTNGMVVKQLFKLGLPMIQPSGLMSIVGASICGLLVAIGFFVGKKFLL